MKNEVVITCTSCNKKLLAPVEYSFRRVICSHCGQTIILPNLDTFEYRIGQDLNDNYGNPNMLTAYSRCFDFSGRATRMEFWSFTIWYYVATAILISILFQDFFTTTWGLVTNVKILSAFIALHQIPAISVTIRRLHDVGRSMILLFAPIIPVIGWILLLYYLVQDSEPGRNKYGRGLKL